jgi:hypothetical protein
MIEGKFDAVKVPPVILKRLATGWASDREGFPGTSGGGAWEDNGDLRKRTRVLTLNPKVGHYATG